jgi:hypothetical protein
MPSAQRGDFLGTSFMFRWAVMLLIHFLSDFELVPVAHVIITIIIIIIIIFTFAFSPSLFP